MNTAADMTMMTISITSSKILSPKRSLLSGIRVVSRLGADFVFFVVFAFFAVVFAAFVFVLLLPVFFTAGDFVVFRPVLLPFAAKAFHLCSQEITNKILYNKNNLLANENH